MHQGIPDRRLLLIVPASFLNSLAIGIVNLGMLFLVKEGYGAGPATVGWFTAFWSIAYFAGCMLLRPLSRLLDARASMALMLLSSAALFTLHLLVPGTPSAFLVGGSYGFLTALFWPRVMGWLSLGLEGALLSRAVGSFNLAWSGGSVLAPFIAGTLAEHGLRLPVIAAILIFLATGLLVLGSGQAIPAPRLSGTASLAGAVKRTAVPSSADTIKDRSSPLRWPAWAGIVLLYALLSVFFSIFPLFAKDELGLGESRIGLILLLRALASAAGFWFFGRLPFWHGKRAWIALAVVLALITDLAFIFIRDPVAIAVALGISGLLMSFSYSASIFYGASGAMDRDHRMTIHEALLTAGQIVGAVTGGLVYQAFSWGAVFAVLAFFLAAGLALQLFLLGKSAR